MVISQTLSYDSHLKCKRLDNHTASISGLHTKNTTRHLFVRKYQLISYQNVIRYTIHIFLHYIVELWYIG